MLPSLSAVISTTDVTLLSHRAAVGSEESVKRTGPTMHCNTHISSLTEKMVDMDAKMECERLCYIRLNQTKLRCDSYIHLRDALRNDADPRNIGKMCMLPATFTGCPRYMHARTQDAMRYVRKNGRPVIFITFTWNPQWQEGSVDNIQDFLSGRVISRTEGPWHIFSFPIHERFPAIAQLVVHLENTVRYFSADTVMDVAARIKDTTLTVFFIFADRASLLGLYCTQTCLHTTCGQKRTPALGGSAAPTSRANQASKTTPHSEEYSRFPHQECFYLRLLLQDISDPTSYNNLRTINGVLCDTFREACLRVCLLEDDSQWDVTMAEGALLKMPSALRHLLTTILQMCEPSDPKSLWDKFQDCPKT
ncbi:unnamed protein product [Acanthosepion pharaonis]|uniref:Helitron helicase-like domain-containing protein n=1 Tax=Acanthosepion pharaonis TaxID=158019 RepID=A0A812B462_ACAPH|nr:unnamed protein product [Sepia pharaonis]